MKIKTSELTGAALDWAVAKCEGIPTAEFVALQKLPSSDDVWKYHYSTDWAQGGPIIERKKIVIAYEYATGRWQAYIQGNGDMHHGLTPLIAAMRCYCASKLGDKVEVPDGLL